MAPGIGAAALDPVSAVGRALVACWVLQKQLTAWRKTTYSLLARQEGGRVDLRVDAVLLQDSAVMQVRRSSKTDFYLHVAYRIYLYMVI